MSEELPTIVDFSVDLGKQDQPEPLPTGRYHGVIKSAEVRISARETRYGDVAFFISADQYPADFKDGNPDGTTLHYRRVGLEDNPQARYGTRRFIEAIGAPLGKQIDLGAWIGLEASLEIDHETYENVTRANVKRVEEA